MKKDYIWNTLGNSANSFISLLLLIVVTRVNGMADTGVFSFCFSYACVFFVIGIYGGRVYQVSDISGEFESKNYIFLKFITSVAMMIAVVVFILVNHYDTERAALLISLALYKMTEAIADPLYGVAQRNDRLYRAGMSMFMKPVVGFIAFVAVDLLTMNILLASFCLLAGNILFILVWDIPNALKLEHITGLFKGNLKPSLFLLRTCAFFSVVAFLIYLLPNIPRYFVDAYFDEETVGWYGLIIMPATMLNLFVLFVVQPKLLAISEMYDAKNYKGFGKSVTGFIVISLAFGAFATFLIWIVGCPILSFILGKDFYPYREALTLVVVGGTINTLTMILTNILTIMRKFAIQVIGCLVGTAAAFAMSIVLVIPQGIMGSVWAFIIAVSAQAVVFAIGYRVALLSRRKSRDAENAL